MENKSTIRNAFKMKLKPGFQAEYKLRHDRIWPELQTLLSESGIQDYSIFLDEETLILFAVVFLVILKNAINWIYGVLGIVAFSLLLMIGYKFYKKITFFKATKTIIQNLIDSSYFYYPRYNYRESTPG